MRLPDDTSAEGGTPPGTALWRSRFPALSIGVLGCLAALVAFLHIHDSDAESDSLRFQRLVDRVASRVAEITRRYEYGLRGGSGLLAAAEHVGPAEWRRYVSSHGLQTEFPGALGFGIVRPVPGRGGAPEVLQVTCIEPLERNAGALGQDLGLRPEARLAAEQAMQTGRPTLTVPLPDLQEGGHWGFLFFVPCYEEGAPIDTEEQRRSALVGWIYAPIVLDRMLAGVAAQLEYQVDFEIFDETWSGARTPLYDWDGDLLAGMSIDALERREGRRFVTHRTIEAGQRRWTTCVSSLPTFNSSRSSWMGWLVLEGGVVASVLLALFVRGQQTQRERAERLVEARTRELREKNRSLEAARAAADEATRAKSQFLANMSHEIRTPMTAILGFAELLRDPRCSAEERSEYLSTIHGNGNHLLSVINDILDLSKIEAGRLEIESIACSPRAIVEEVLAWFAPRARAKELTLRASWPAHVPERIQTDPVRARQVLVNLVGNALKFTERGEVHVESSFEERPSGGAYWVCRVHDTGIGIDPARLEQVFEPFTQGDSSTTRRFGGTGLGLPIARKLAVLLGGGLSARSAPGQGCTFEARIAAGTLAHPDCAAPLASRELPAALP
jgi:signal transduction histidine kinase